MSALVKFLSSTKLLHVVESLCYTNKFLIVKVGSMVKINFLITEGNKERNQIYEGIVISKRNSGINKTLTVRKIIQGIGVERVFLNHSPKLTSLTTIKLSHVRRSKLYYLKKLAGKKARLKQCFN
jgi:large subunit ribosomal protein L19